MPSSPAQAELDFLRQSRSQPRFAVLLYHFEYCVNGPLTFTAHSQTQEQGHACIPALGTPPP